MDVKEQIKLNYPEEFRIACKINNLRHAELLQYFIDHVSFYAFIGGEMDLPYLWATTVSIDCKEVRGKEVEVVADQKIREVSLKYIKKLTALTQKDDLGKSSQTLKSNALMKEWSAEMFDLTDYQKVCHTEAGEVFSITFDFNLLCRMNGIDINLLLQYFIDHISLARERAVNLLKEVKMDPSTAVLLIQVAHHEDVKNRVLPHQEIYKQYGLRLLKLDKKQKEEKDLEIRIKNYSDFYREWYHALNKNIN